MTTKTFRNLEELKPYYIEKTNTYNFTDFDLVEFKFDLRVESNINANDIYALNIKAYNIDACDIDTCDIKAWNIDACDIEANNIDARNINTRNITARDIDAKNIIARDINAYDIITCNINACTINALNIIANDILYYAFCIAYYNIKCKSIKGRRDNSFHKALDGVVEVLEDE